MTAGLGETFPELVDWFRDAAPVGRLGVPQDLSPMVCHLLSDAGSFITGSDILITGKSESTGTRLH
jgi:NAD(P)-dependent dehydrogenase (short-subunit alcohol dehydrogenase family)